MQGLRTSLIAYGHDPALVQARLYRLCRRHRSDLAQALWLAEPPVVLGYRADRRGACVLARGCAHRERAGGRGPAAGDALERRPGRTAASRATDQRADRLHVRAGSPARPAAAFALSRAVAARPVVAARGLRLRGAYRAAGSDTAGGRGAAAQPRRKRTGEEHQLELGPRTVPEPPARRCVCHAAVPGIRNPRLRTDPRDPSQHFSIIAACVRPYGLW